jgi:hypothetical protein
MDKLIGLLITAVVIPVIVFASWKSRQKVKAAVMQSFDRLTFDTPAGRVTGAELKIVRVSKQTMQLGDDLHTLGHDAQPSDAFLYCVGPGPSYFLAIAIARTGFGAVSVDWVVRPLTEQRMRGALIGDRKATSLAFGNAAEL